MTLYAIAFPAIDPVAVHIGPLPIRWYALAYIAGILLGWQYMRMLARRPPQAIGLRDVDDFVVWATLAIVLGGRFGYVLFYKPGYYVERPLEALALWQGGMSFHGGLIGVIVAIFLFAHLRKLSWLKLGDLVVCAVPIGLFFGRIANFINGELYGRPSDAPWAMAFPHGGPLPRHPSQLYEAALEGLVLFVVLYALAWHTRALERPGFLAGVFLAGYAIARVIGELFREPDAHLGFLALGATMGQLLSLPVLLAGLYLIWHARRRL
jgi:phosphatidylglycerol:prolipoprotein diacylglycerol transferase